MEVTFKFELNQKVKTIFGDIGIIVTLAFDEGEIIKYWVQRSSDSQWMKEDQLEVAEEKEFS